jgi:chemotaxis protein methyltransferase CheR
MINRTVISDEELSSIIKAIFSRYGIDFSNYEATSLKRRINRIIDKNKMECSLDLWKKIIYEQDFIYYFIDEVTVGLTEMFRNADMWISIKKKLLQEIKDQKEIKIWHAGCSTGEEVYSMGILLNEVDLTGKTSIIATDLNSQSIKMAKEGIFHHAYELKYKKNYLAAEGKKRLDDYYIMSNDWMKFSKVDSSQMSFYQHNLSKDPMKQKYDIILCRNVMIYFDDILKMKLMKYFYECLNEGGFFIIGYYDALPEQAQIFFVSFDASTKILRKKKATITELSLMK